MVEDVAAVVDTEALAQCDQATRQMVIEGAARPSGIARFVFFRTCRCNGGWRAWILRNDVFSLFLVALCRASRGCQARSIELPNGTSAVGRSRHIEQRVHELTHVSTWPYGDLQFFACLFRYGGKIGPTFELHRSPGECGRPTLRDTPSALATGANSSDAHSQNLRETVRHCSERRGTCCNGHPHNRLISL